MTIPTLPTDNLYKFIFMAGLLLIISSLVLYTSYYNNLNKWIANDYANILKKELEGVQLIEDHKNKEEEIREAKQTLSTNPTPTKEESEELRKLNSELAVIHKKIDHIQDRFEIGSEENDTEITHYYIVLTFSLALLLGGSILTFYGYKKWKVLVQDLQDEKLKLEVEQLKAQVKPTG